MMRTREVSTKNVESAPGLQVYNNWRECTEPGPLGGFHLFIEDRYRFTVYYGSERSLIGEIEAYTGGVWGTYVIDGWDPIARQHNLKDFRSEDLLSVCRWLLAEEAKCGNYRCYIER